MNSLLWFGTLMLWLALVMAGGAVGLYALSLKRPQLKLWGRRAFFGMGIFTALTAGYLWTLILTQRYEVEYVWQWTSRDLEFPFRFSAFWNGTQGTFFLWTFYTFLLGLVLLRKVKNTDYEAPSMLFLSTIPCSILLLSSIDNPFVPTPRDALTSFPDGSGMNLLLQSRWMTIHPPIMFLGYASMGVPFALAMASLLRRDPHGWVRFAMPFAAWGLAILGTGIVLGGLWSYNVLGWGGYWMWDPVENASIIPWFACGALVHGLLIQRSRKSMVRFNLLMGILCFIFAYYATFVTRSGLISSVHAFGTTPMTWWLLGILLTYLVGCLGVWVFRWKAMKPDREAYQSAGSWQFWAYYSGIAFVVCCLLVFVGLTTPFFGPLVPPEHVEAKLKGTPIVVTLKDMQVKEGKLPRAVFEFKGATPTPKLIALRPGHSEWVGEWLVTFAEHQPLMVKNPTTMEEREVGVAALLELQKDGKGKTFTLRPEIQERGKQINILPSFYNKVFAPVVLFMLVLLSVVPFYLVPKSQIPNPKSQIPNPKSQIPNPKSQISNPKSQIPNPKSQASSLFASNPFWTCANIAIFAMIVTFWLHRRWMPPVGKDDPDVPLAWILILVGAAAFALSSNTYALIHRWRKAGFLQTGAFLAHIGFAMFLLGIVGTDMHSRSDELYVYQGRTAKALNCHLEFEDVEEVRAGEEYRAHLRVRRNGREFNIPLRFYTRQNRAAIGKGGAQMWVYQPYVEKLPLMDIYYAPNWYYADGTTLELKPGEEQHVGEWSVKLVRFEVPEKAFARMMAGEGVKVLAWLELSHHGANFPVVATVEAPGKGKQFLSEPAQVPDSPIWVSIERMEVERRKVVFKIEGIGEPTTLSLSKGEAKQVGDWTVRFENFHVSDEAHEAMMQEDSFKAGAVVTLSRNGIKHRLVPVVWVPGESGLVSKPVHVEGTNLKVRLERMQVGEDRSRKAIVRLTGIGHFIALNLQIKPLINLARLGIFLLLFGILVAAIRRFREGRAIAEEELEGQRAKATKKSKKKQPVGVAAAKPMRGE